jgi:hypothetical protein
LWIPVIAALGASFLTGVAGFGLELIRDALGKEHDEWRRRRDAYVAFLIASANMLAMLSSLREIRKRGYRSLQVYKLHQGPDRVPPRLQPRGNGAVRCLDEGLARRQPGGIEAANRFVDAAIPATEAASAPGKARPLMLTRLPGEA